MTSEQEAEGTIVTLKSALPPLPSWTDGAAIASYIVSIVTFAFGVLSMFHIGLPSDTSTVVQGLATGLGYTIAAIVQIVNIVSHRNNTTKIHLAMLRLQTEQVRRGERGLSG